MTTTDAQTAGAEPGEAAPTLDASDLDQYMGVPMEPGELKEPVATQRHPPLGAGHALPEPAALRRDVGGREPLRRDRGAAVVHRGLRHEPRLLACAGRHDPELAPHLRRRRLVVLRPPRAGRRQARLPPDALRLQGHRHEVRRPDLLPARRHALHQPARRAGRAAALHRHPLPGAGGQGEEALLRADRAEWTDDQLADLEERKLAFIDQIQQLRHDKRLFDSVAGRRPSWPATCSARTAWPASPPSGGPSR